MVALLSLLLILVLSVIVTRVSTLGELDNYRAVEQQKDDETRSESHA